MKDGQSILTWDRYLPNPPDDLFVDRTDAVCALSDSEISKSNPVFFDLVMHPPALKDFFIWFLNTHYRDALEVYEKEMSIPLPSRLGENMTSQTFRKEAAQFGDKRNTGEHPLKRKAYLSARKRIKEDQDLMRAMHTIEMGVRYYYTNLQKQIIQQFQKQGRTSAIKEIGIALQPVYSGINANGLTMELLPVLAKGSFKKERTLVPSQIMENFRDALTGLRAFDSLSGLSIGNEQFLSNIPRTCPFKQTMAALMTMDIVKNADGTVSLGDQPKPGGLFFFIYRSLKEKGPDQTPAHKPA